MTKKKQKNQKKKNKKRSASVWDSGLTILDEPKIIIPEEIDKVCKAIQDEVGSNEFSVLVKGEYTKNGFRLLDDYYIPEQEVTSTTVEYDENLRTTRNKGYNCLIHSHPFSKDVAFSSADENTVNSHFTAAVLYNGNQEAVTGKLRLQIENKTIMKVDASVVTETIIPDIDVSNISEKPVKVTRSRTISRRQPYYGRQVYPHLTGYGTPETHEIDKDEFEEGLTQEEKDILDAMGLSEEYEELEEEEVAT